MKERKGMQHDYAPKEPRTYYMGNVEAEADDDYRQTEKEILEDQNYNVKMLKTGRSDTRYRR